MNTVLVLEYETIGCPMAKPSLIDFTLVLEYETTACSMAKPSKIDFTHFTGWEI